MTQPRQSPWVELFWLGVGIITVALVISTLVLTLAGCVAV
jgi:hypothetical protein